MKTEAAYRAAIAELDRDIDWLRGRDSNLMRAFQLLRGQYVIRLRKMLGLPR